MVESYSIGAEPNRNNPQCRRGDPGGSRTVRWGLLGLPVVPHHGEVLGPVPSRSVQPHQHSAVRVPEHLGRRRELRHRLRRRKASESADRDQVLLPGLLPNHPTPPASTAGGRAGRQALEPRGRAAEQTEPPCDRSRGARRRGRPRDARMGARRRPAFCAPEHWGRDSPKGT